MRKVTEKVVGAFLKQRKCCIRNTKTDGTNLYLFGNLIARHTSEGLMITSAGWQSVTTKERLNALPGVSITQMNYKWFLNGEPWDGSATIISLR